MATIAMHPSLQLAHAVLDLVGVMLHEDETRDFDVSSFSNCREQGLMVRAPGGFRCAFAQHRISDEIVVYSGDVKDFDPDHKPIDGGKWKLKEFDRHEIYEAAQYVVGLMREAASLG